MAGELAYNTVHTILVRLGRKRLVARVPAGCRARYRATKNAAELAAEQMHAALGWGSDRTEVVRRFVEEAQIFEVIESRFDGAHDRRRVANRAPGAKPRL